MARKPTPKKIVTQQMSVPLLWIMIAILAVTQAVSFWHITELQSHNNKTPEQMTAFVNSMEQSRYRYPAIDAKENRLYIPEARIFLPLNETTRDIRYQYASDRLTLSVAYAVGRQSNNDSPSCDRIVVISPSNQLNSDYTAAGIVPSKDGEPLYIAKHNKCKIYNIELSNQLAEAAKEIQYY